MEFVTLVLENIVPAVITLLASVLTAFLVGLIKKYGSKIDTEIKNNLESLITDIVTQGVSLAEEWANNKKKAYEPINSDDKLSVAIDYILKQLEKNGVYDIFEAEIIQRIESVLGLSRIDIEVVDNNREVKNDETS